MKKRVKLIAVVSSFCLCLSLFVMGIFAATSVTLNVTSSISFKADGVFVKVSAQLRQGPTADDATLQSGAPDTYQYTGYSYNRESGSDLPDGSATLDNFVNADGTEDSTWEIGEIQFTDELPVVVYHFTFTNYSPMPVQVSVTSNIQTLKTEMTGILDITEAYSNGTIMAGYTTDSSPSSTVYTITVELEKFTNSFELRPLGLTINFTTEIPDENDYPNLTFTSNGDGTARVEAANKSITTAVIPSAVAINGTPHTVTSIGTSAFYDCTSLASITIPDSVTSIGDWAFSGCGSLTSVTIPDSVTSIGEGAFYGCDALQYTTFNNGEYLGNESNPYLVLCDTETTDFTSFTISDNCKLICYYTFQFCSSLESITIPEGVTSIGDLAFDGCSSLTSIEIPNSVTNICYYAFSGCSSLTSITIPDSVTSIGGYAFYNCTSLESITIPNSVTNLSPSIFKNCSALTNFLISDSVTSIGEEAFSYCSSLTSITIPSLVTSIGDLAFIGCSALTTVTIKSDDVYKTATGPAHCGRLLYYATTVNVLKTCVDGSNTYLESTGGFTRSESGDYYVYKK